MKHKIGAVLVSLALLGTGVGCGTAMDEVTGTLKAKEYEERNCDRRVKGKCKSWDPAEYELTIQRSDGSEVELVVGKYAYNHAVVGTQGTWKGRLD